MKFFKDKDFSWRVLLIESLVIMLSVLLGFMLNSWRQNNDQQKTVQKALKSIAIEVRYNQNQMQRLLPEYKFMRDTLHHISMLKGGKTPMKMTELPAGAKFSMPALRSPAFETAQSSGAMAAMDFETAQKIWTVYNFQKLYADLINQLTTGLILEKFNTVQDWQLAFKLLAGNGALVSKLYPDVLHQLEKEYDISILESASVDSNAT